MVIGLVSASKKSVNHVLSKEDGGNVSIIVIGGAEEALDAHPGSLTLDILKRKGFIKVALKRGEGACTKGSSISFGENELFQQVSNLKGSLLRCWNVPVQIRPDAIQDAYPYVGRPVPVKQTSHPTQEEIETLHQQYLSALQELFEEHKERYGIPEHESLVFM